MPDADEFGAPYTTVQFQVGDGTGFSASTCTLTINVNAVLDTFTGTVGDDLFASGDGNDDMTGNGGSDIFVFDTAPNDTTNSDVIQDFAAGEDELHLDNDIFTVLGAAGPLSGNNFVSSAGGVTDTSGDADDFIKYDSSTCIHYYDSDGNGSGGFLVEIVALNGQPAIGAGDITVID